MSDDTPLPAGDALDEKKKRKKAEKARGVWISFAGRIVAQVVGAVASVVLGVMVLQRYQSPSTSAPSAIDTPPVATSLAPAPTPRRPGAAIAVLPLENISRNPDEDYFVDGMTEALVASLAKVEGLRVISRTSTMRYKTDHPSIPEIAKALGVDVVVEGSVLQAGDQVRITAQLIDGATDEHLWAESYTRTLKDVIGLQDVVADAIATAIKGTVVHRARPQPTSQRAVDSSTYDLFLRGRHAWFKRTPEAMQAALGYFEQAAARDPEFALAHVGIADTYVLQGSPGMPLDAGRERMQKARAAAERALDIDPSLAEAHTALGGVAFFGERALADAEKRFRRAIELNPNYPVAHEWLGLLLGEQGRTAEGLSHAKTAVSLDPFEATMHQALGLIQYNGRKFDDAITSERRAFELSGQLPLAKVILTKALVLAGRPVDAMANCATLSDAAGQVDLRIACVIAATRAGRQAEANALRAPLQARRPEPGAALAQIDAALEQLPAALSRLEPLAARGGLAPVFVSDPLFDALRRHPSWSRITQLQQSRGVAPASHPNAAAR